jgi:NTE family protein
MVGAVCAVGQCDVLEELALDIDWKRSLYYFMEVNFPRSGLIDGIKIERLLRDIIGDQSIASLDIPYAAVATDIIQGSEVLLTDGDLVQAVRTSIAIPGIFTPVRRNGRFLVDGGLVNPLPVSAARRLGAEYVIAVEVNLNRKAGNATTLPPAATTPVETDQQVRRIKDRFLEQVNQRLEQWNSPVFDPVRRWVDRDTAPNVFDILTRTIRIAENQVTQRRLEKEPPDLLLQPRVGHMESLDFSTARQGIEAGYTAVMDKADKLQAILRHPSKIREFIHRVTPD